MGWLWKCEVFILEVHWNNNVACQYDMPSWHWREIVLCFCGLGLYAVLVSHVSVCTCLRRVLRLFYLRTKKCHYLKRSFGRWLVIMTFYFNTLQNLEMPHMYIFIPERAHTRLTRKQEQELSCICNE